MPYASPRHALMSVTVTRGLAVGGALLGVLVLSLLSSGRHAMGAPGVRAPVVVELFTSEGCSSCPSAERVLGRLAREQSVPGAEIVLLSFHVDYWDTLGWADPFASPAFTDRQRGYATLSNRVYTPQAVVDGQVDFVGSDEGRARSAIQLAAETPKVRLEIVRGAAEGGLLGLDVRVPAGVVGNADRVALVLLEDGLRVDVKAGENAGQRLEHPAVVRALVVLAPGPGGTFHADVRVAASWKRENLRAVAFVEGTATHAIGAVGTLSRP